MRHCAFDTCMCRARHRRHGISFHEFPKCDEIRNKWMSVVRSDKRDPTWSPKPHTRICSLHFSRSQFLSKKVLHARAVPTARYEAPKFLRPYRRGAAPREAEETVDSADDIPSDLDAFPIAVPAAARSGAAQAEAEAQGAEREEPTAAPEVEAPAAAAEPLEEVAHQEN